jgi:hypothetical protein
VTYSHDIKGYGLILSVAAGSSSHDDPSITKTDFYLSDFKPGGNWIFASAIDSGKTILRLPSSVHWKTVPTAVSWGLEPKIA